MEELPAPPSRPSRRRRLPAIATIVAVAVVVIAVLVAMTHDAIAGSLLDSVAQRFGYHISEGGLRVGLTQATIDGLTVDDGAGLPLLRARRVEIGYSLRDLLPGGKRLFGLTSVRVEGAHATLVHRADGSYNVALPAASQNPAQAAPPPLDLTLSVSDTSVTLVDRYAYAPAVRSESIENITVEGAIAPHRPSSYRAHAALVVDGARYPIAGAGRFGGTDVFAIHRWTAAHLPIARLAEFALSTHAIALEAGSLDDLTATYGSLPSTAGGMDSHLGVRAQLSGIRLRSAALTAPIRDGRGPLVVDGTSAALPSFDATLNGTRLHLRGAVFDLASPQVAAALSVRGDLGRIRALSRDVARQPISGTLAASALVEGAASSPLVFARVRAPAIRYAALRIDDARAFAAVSGQQLDVLQAGAAYGPVALRARAAVELKPHATTAAYLAASIPADTLPYVDAIVPGVPLTAGAVVRGVDRQLAVRGLVSGAGDGTQLAFPFSVGADGRGAIGPLALERRDGASVYARAYLDAPARRTVAVVDVRGLSLLAVRHAAATLPGLRVPPLPSDVSTRIDGHLVASAQGTTLQAASGSLDARGSWGDLEATAAGATTGVAAQGRLHSSFARLAALGGASAQRLGVSGAIDAPFRLASVPGGAVLQVERARFPGGSVRGISLDGADATIGARAGSVQVYAADLRAGGQTIGARGRLGSGGRLRLTAGNLDAGVLRHAGLPQANGRATVLATISGTLAQPRAALAAVLAGARVRGTDVDADVGLRYAGGTLTIRRANALVGAAVFTANGRVSGLLPGHIAPRYDVDAHLRQAEIATLAAQVKTPLRYPEGTVEADVRVRGAGRAPYVTGTLGSPEGSVNGLAWNGARVAFDATPTHLHASNGRVDVGTSRVAFSADVSRRAQRAQVDAPHLDLADFNPYFDEADVLAGTGSAMLRFADDADRVAVDSDVMMTGVAIKRYALGMVRSHVRTNGTHITVAGRVSGPNGSASLDGGATVPQHVAARDLLRRSDVDLTGSIGGLALDVALPAAGFSAPIAGSVDGRATVRGRYPALDVSAHAAVVRGVAGRLPIDRLTLDATAARGRGRITNLTLDAPGLAVRGSGTFGLQPRAPFDLRVNATSPDVGRLVTAATGAAAGASGTLALRAEARGTAVAPALTATLDADALAYRKAHIPHVHLALDASRSAVAIRNGLVSLEKGSVAFGARVPLTGRISDATPVAASFAPHGVDLAPFAPLLPGDAALTGAVNGDVTVGGTVGAPVLGGSLALDGGSYRSKLLTSPLTAIALRLDFSRTSVRLARLHADAAPGTFNGSGSLTVGNLRDPLRSVRGKISVTASDARIAAPAYYTGFIDGSVSVAKAPRAPIALAGALTFSRGRIPYTTLLPSSGGSTSSGPDLPPIDLALDVTAGRDVRVQSGPVDVGATGSVAVGGTLASPTLDGTMTATNGTVSLYRTFVVQSGSEVSFVPSDGVIPSVDATATTQISDPSTSVLLHITGLASHLNLDFSSEPQYSREQILGLLVNAQALGAVSGVASGGGSSAAPSVTGIGEGFLASQFSQKFLTPFTSQIGSAVGLSDLNVGYDVGSGVSASARRKLGKNISFVYGASFGGENPRTSLGIDIGSRISGGQLTYFSSNGAHQAFGGQALTPYLQAGASETPPNYTLEAIEPPSGSSGFVLSYIRRFWTGKPPPVP